MSSKLILSCSGREVEFNPGSTLLEALHKSKVEVDSSCGGMGSCGTCRILVLDWGVAGEQPRNELEQEMAKDRQFSDRERLSCQLKAEHGLKIDLP